MKTSFSTSLYMRYHPGPHSDNQVFHDFIQGPPSISFFFFYILTPYLFSDVLKFHCLSKCVLLCVTLIHVHMCIHEYTNH